MWGMLWDAFLDSVKLLPFLFITYVLMELLEHKAGEKSKRLVARADKVGPLWGGILGIFPQCGFSAAASSLYAGRVITVGTLLAIFLSTSDEMLPIFISQSVYIGSILKILGVKMLIGIISGFLVDFVFQRFIKHDSAPQMDIHAVCEHEHCQCEDGVVVSSLKHTFKVFFFIFIVSIVIGGLVHLVGEERLSHLFLNIPVVGEVIAALVGLIPNCAASVVITELYLKGIISAGAMMAGLLVSSGVGMLVLLRMNRPVKENVKIISLLYLLGVVWGVLIEFSGMAF